MAQVVLAAIVMSQVLHPKFKTIATVVVLFVSNPFALAQPSSCEDLFASADTLGREVFNGGKKSDFSDFLPLFERRELNLVESISLLGPNSDAEEIGKVIIESNEIVMEMAKVLHKRGFREGIDFEVTDHEDLVNLLKSGIRDKLSIEPKPVRLVIKSQSPLLHPARRAMTRLGIPVDAIYHSPLYSLLTGMNANFDEGSRLIGLSIQELSRLNPVFISALLDHELTHGVFAAMRLQGLPSPFHMQFTANPLIRKLPGTLYRRLLSAEEVYTGLREVKSRKDLRHLIGRTQQIRLIHGEFRTGIEAIATENLPEIPAKYLSVETGHTDSAIKIRILESPHTERTVEFFVVKGDSAWKAANRMLTIQEEIESKVKSVPQLKPALERMDAMAIASAFRQLRRSRGKSSDPSKTIEVSSEEKLVAEKGVLELMDEFLKSGSIVAKRALEDLDRLNELSTTVLSILEKWGFKVNGDENNASAQANSEKLQGLSPQRFAELNTELVKAQRRIIPERPRSRP